MINTRTSTTASTNETATTTPTITDKKRSSSIPSTGATTNAEESPPAPTVEFDLESSAVGMTGSVFFDVVCFPDSSHDALERLYNDIIVVSHLIILE